MLLLLKQQKSALRPDTPPAAPAGLQRQGDVIWIKREAALFKLGKVIVVIGEGQII